MASSATLLIQSPPSLQIARGFQDFSQPLSINNKLNQVISAFMLVSIVFIPIGVVSLFASRDVVEIVDRYDNHCAPHGSKDDKVPKHMKKPIYVYYQLDNFYQNHCRYVQSRSAGQLKDASSENDTSTCKPEDATNGSPIVPCGLIAWSLFNDTCNFSRNNEVAVKKRASHRRAIEITNLEMMFFQRISKLDLYQGAKV